MNLNSKWVGVAAVVISLVTVASFFGRGGGKRGPDRFTADAALKELRHPHGDERTQDAILTLRRQGEKALPQILDLYKTGQGPIAYSSALQLLTMLPATPPVVGALIEVLEKEEIPSSQDKLIWYLQEASGQRIKDKQGWRDWWEREGKNRTQFNAPYGTTLMGEKQ